ncbi:heavy-metal-associated domain-containing protein [Cryobacterium sp. PH29-G1]|uniref:heavy-metal-associated domain-containing protein n=1 Tax=Cryobacterium sp. PH29-G1 TaxID=3046211 RepID=UPI0024B9133C|nr:heavy-metal-associated domain-containing protein [Cryobacterium sp. PH29-G1]MDJ0350105.1 heavy-metal-associated domain-containing protein [Cryobacterium sp. PH29-G1]
MSTTTAYSVAGMTCNHCVASVTEEIGLIAGAENVSVDLVKGGTSRVTVTSADALDRTLVAAAVEEAGYQLVAAA